LENEDYSRINNTSRSISNTSFRPHQAQFQPFFVAIDSMLGILACSVYVTLPLSTC